MTVGLVVVTYNRPEYAYKSLRAAAKHLKDVVAHTVIVNDGSDRKHAGSYKRAYKVAAPLHPVIFDEVVNRGVAFAKNRGLSYLLENTDCDWLFVLEDDIIIQGPEAVTEYVRVAEAVGLHHLALAHHGPANLGVPLSDDDISFFPHSVGAWTSFTRECLEAVGLMDETFVRAWEHVSHELDLIVAGFMPGADAYKYPDATHSQKWLTEIPGSIEKSSIRPLPDWFSNIHDGLEYWKSHKPDTFNMLFGPNKPLHAYANQILQ